MFQSASVFSVCELLAVCAHSALCRMHMCHILNVVRCYICAHSWNRVRYRLQQYAMIFHMMYRIPVHVAKYGIRLRYVLVCVCSIALTCVNAIRIKILVVHVNAPHHT